MGSKEIENNWFCLSECLFLARCRIYTWLKKNTANNFCVRPILLRRLLKSYTLFVTILRDQYRQLWSLDTRVVQIADVMTCNEFKLSKNVLHFCENNFLHWVTKRFRISFHHKKFQHNWTELAARTFFSRRTKYRNENSENFTVPLHSQQPKEMGLQMSLRTSSKGLIVMYNFKLVQEKTTSQGSLGLSCSDKLKFSENSNVKTFFDNWFSSVEILIDELSSRVFLNMSTSRPDREPELHFSSDRDMKEDCCDSFCHAIEIQKTCSCTKVHG